MGGPTVQSLNQLGQFEQNTLNNINANNLYAARQQAAQRASQLAQAGDYRGAYGAMMGADPDFAAKILPDLTKIDPDFAAQLTTKTGQAASDIASQTQSNPGQVAKTQADARIAAAEARANMLQNKLNSVTLAGGQKGFISNKDLMNGNTGNVVVPGGQTNSSTTASGETNPLAGLGKDDQKQVNTYLQGLNKDPDMKDFNTEITGLQQAEDLARGNLPNSQVPLTMKFLQSSEFIRRFNAQEYKEGPLAPKAVLDKINNWIATGMHGNVDPNVMSEFNNILDVMKHSTFNEYQGALDQRAQQLSKATGGRLSKEHALDTLISGSNPIFAKKAGVYASLPASDKKAVDWARQNLGDPKAMAILKANGL